MTLTALKHRAETADWFANLGHFTRAPGFREIPSLDAWRSEDADAVGADVADAMDWLPSSNDQSDPFYGPELVALMKKVTDPAAKAGPAEIYQVVLASLAQMQEPPALKVGPHDFTGAARKGALFAFQSAAMESITGHGSRWQELTELYARGFWPCGLLPSGEIVVL